MPAMELDRATRRMGEDLVLDELFDLRLYERFRDRARGPLRGMLEDLVVVEAGHYKFWKDFFGIDRQRLNPGRRVKLAVLSGICRVAGPAAVSLVLEGIEIYGIRKYLELWDQYRDKPLGNAVRQILNDEMEHEDVIVSQFVSKKISPERVRTIFMGFNDGLVEILGAVSGFFAALREPRLVLAASVSVAAAGAFSMAAGAYAATGSEREIERTQRRKDAFLGRTAETDDGASPLSAAALVGLSYFLGASLPVLPVFFGATGVAISAVAAAAAVTVVSAGLAFLSGMDMGRRVLLNLGIVAGAVAMTSLLGSLAHRWLGVSL